MEQQMSLMDLVLNAGLTVQAVMAVLLMASVVSWFMISQRLIYCSDGGRSTNGNRHGRVWKNNSTFQGKDREGVCPAEFVH